MRTLKKISYGLGAAAALAVKRGEALSELPVKLLQETLQNAGVRLHIED